MSYVCLRILAAFALMTYIYLVHYYFSSSSKTKVPESAFTYLSLPTCRTLPPFTYFLPVIPLQPVLSLIITLIPALSLLSAGSSAHLI